MTSSWGQIIHAAEERVWKPNYQVTETQALIDSLRHTLNDRASWQEDEDFDEFTQDRLRLRSEISFAEARLAYLRNLRETAQANLHRVKTAYRVATKDEPKRQRRGRKAKSLPEPTVASAMTPDDYKLELRAWKERCDQAFANRSTMVGFPEPPAVECSLGSCARAAQHSELSVCKCAIQSAFSLLPSLFPQGLKNERLRWHPDKFSVCSDLVRDEFRSKASELFVVVNAMYEKETTTDTSDNR
jgi:hypothetical protein